MFPADSKACLSSKKGKQLFFDDLQDLIPLEVILETEDLLIMGTIVSVSEISFVFHGKNSSNPEYLRDDYQGDWTKQECKIFRKILLETREDIIT
ncbi:MAG: Unknown protein [uncultured Sulfurovum sp.]|uniref:Uncharacterized protein n=1 Tax=uncultured Sulfurovum sp. TaxID=269237 RepID=A0A6S6SNQ4_9BACT|nr:MAG: Unknown protein [uncultured Sulfurovum sp.]